MSRDAWGTPYIQRLFETGSLNGLSGWQLVERFARNRDQAAFELLVARHGPMVFGVCRRILHDPSDADDAFQATFLVLIRRAQSLGPTDVMAAWLHGVALKVARRARVRRERLNQRERSSDGVEPPSPAPRDPDFALRAVLDEEIDRLPWKYRAAVTLCYLQGLTHEEAARLLDWPIGTVKGRLARARTTLGARLSRRGITSAAGAVAGSLILHASLQAAPSQSLLAAAVRASARIADGRAWDAVVSASIADLVRGVFTAMLLSKLKVATALLLISGLTVTGAGVYGRQPGEVKKPEPVDPPPAVAAENNPRSDDEPTRPGPETTRVASSRDDPEVLQKQLAEAAQQAFRASFEEYEERPQSPERVYRASQLLLDAKLEAAQTSASRVAAHADHAKRMDALARVVVRQRSGNIKPDSIAAEARAFQAEAALRLAKSRSGEPLDKTSPTPESTGDLKDSSPATIAILARLEDPIAMNFPNEMPLEDVLRYVKQATQGSNEQGIPIYVDPIGLSEAEKTMTSPISIDLDGVPLRRTLQLMLNQIGLAYFVDDGLLVITSKESAESTLPPSMVKISPLLEKQMKAERGELSEDELMTLLAQLESIIHLKELVDRKDSVRGETTVQAASPVASEQVQTLIMQMKELTDALKAAQGRSTGGSGLQ